MLDDYYYSLFNKKELLQIMRDIKKKLAYIQYWDGKKDVVYIDNMIITTEKKRINVDIVA